MKRALTLLMMLALLSPPLLTLAAEQVTPNNIQRIGAAPRTCPSLPPFGESPKTWLQKCDTPLDYSAVNVAVVDTGIDLHNPDLNVVGGVDCTTPPANPFALELDELTFTVEAYQDGSWDAFARPEARGYDDGLGHGTHVAGIIGARDDGRGVVGVAPNASLWSVRVLDATGSGSISNIVCGLDWIHDNRDLIDVVNMSLGADTGEPVMDLIESCDEVYPPPAPVYLPQPEKKLQDPLHEAICQLYEDGIPVVVAAGNGPGDSQTTIPAAYPEVIAVSSFVDNDGLPGGLGGRNDEDTCPFGGSDDMFFAHHNFTPEQRFQSYSGPAVDIMAPGVCILSTVPGGFASLTGTSMASPHVAGIVARYLGDHPAPSLLDVEDVRVALLANAEQQDGSFRDVDGYWEPAAQVIP